MAKLKMSSAERILSGPAGRVVVVAVFLGVWELAARAGWISTFFFSSPSEIFDVVLGWLSEGRVFSNLGYTLTEAFIGLAIGSCIGTALGFVMAFLPRVAAVFEPFMAIMNSFPRLTLAPLFVVWFGFGMQPKIALVAMFILFIGYLNAYTGLQQVSTELVDRARLWGASRWDLVRSIYLPAVAAWIFTGLRASIGFAVIGAVIGEYIGGDFGIGFLILEGESRLRIREVFAGLLILLIAAAVIDYCLRRLEARFLRWRPTASSPRA